MLSTTLTAASLSVPALGPAGLLQAPEGGGPESLALRLDGTLVGRELLQIAVVVLLAWLGYRGIVFLTRRVEKKVGEEEDPDLLTAREQRTQTVAQLARNVAMVGLAVVAVLTVLNLFIPIGPLLGSVGVFGLVISFGAQTLVRDVISGFFVLAGGQ